MPSSFQRFLGRWLAAALRDAFSALVSDITPDPACTEEREITQRVREGWQLHLRQQM